MQLNMFLIITFLIRNLLYKIYENNNKYTESFKHNDMHYWIGLRYLSLRNLRKTLYMHSLNILIIIDWLFQFETVCIRLNKIEYKNGKCTVFI